MPAELSTTPPERHRMRGRALGVALVAAFMTLLDVSIVNVAIPSMQAGLRIGASGLQWVLSGYALTFGLLLVPAGRFGDARGIRPVFVAGLLGFTAASAAAGAAQSEAWLVTARLVQGAFAGVVNPQVTGLIQRLYPPAERARPFGLLGAVIGIATAAGPLLGGVIIQVAGHENGWRWVFYINLPVGLAAAVLGWRLIPRRPAERRRRESLDPVGVLLLGLAVVQILLPLIEQRHWYLLGTGTLTLAGFVWWELRYPGVPLADLQLFRRRSYALGTAVVLVYFAGFTANFFILTLYLQRGQHFTALEAGLAITPFALGSALAAFAGGRVVDRFGRPLVVAGLSVVLAGLTGIFVVLHAGVSPWVLTAPLLVAGLGSGLVITPNQTLTLADVPVDRSGSAAGVVQTAQRVGAAFGIAAIGAVFFARLTVTSGDWAAAFEMALMVAIAFLGLALAAAVTDVVIARRTR
ncbi:MFS transporter [Dactylosporangium aurantiacum]|uniref:MFS transporter n=1 Tax=Dactylosporangium aurantiacum TaxID=35754 RepID=A0A9Q9IFZ6_9ACTN|nr:MFS transporter [Dactylosporangium aurantiacum]MDG6103641.1 MFS transporter [Dactylosporangium aurantiacum]UWZ51870.1 MFS transporter [Dactylosporangium aurantiacum]